MTLTKTLIKTLATTKKSRRRLILVVSTLAGACAVLAPSILPSIFSSALPSLGSIESAAPPYFDRLTSIEPPAGHEREMILLREQAGLALAQLQQIKTAGN